MPDRLEVGNVKEICAAGTSTMGWPEVERRIVAREDASTEFRGGSGGLCGVGRTRCMFANGNGDLLVLGVDDAT